MPPGSARSAVTVAAGVAGMGQVTGGLVPGADVGDGGGQGLG